VDQIVVARVDVPGPWRVSRRRRRRLGPVLAISLWLHLTLLLLLLVTVQYQHRQEELPPPAAVAMVFEGGKPEGPAVPKPQLEIPAPASPPAPPPAPVPAPRATVEQPRAPSPPRIAEPAPVPEAPLPLPPVPVPAPPPPPLPPVAMAVPRPVPPPPPLRPVPTPSQRPAAPAPSTAFPAPMNYSFNQPTPSRPQQRTASRGLSTLDFSLAPRQGANDVTPFSRVAGAHVGADWRNELSAWVRAHAYYPEQAAMNGEDGDVMVRVMANPDGRVTGVEMRSKSGSVWLDMALMALFRDAHLPPLHDENEPITFDFLMHYILIRGR
jgi:TonB family protein